MTKISYKIRSLLAKKVSRKEFLKILGMTTISLMGLSNLTKLADDTSRSEEGSYGDSSYGI